MLNVKVLYSDARNYGGRRKKDDIKYIVIHYTANKGDTAYANANYFATRKVGASAHFFVDENDIFLSVPEDFTAWSVGGKKYPNTKGGAFHGICTNGNSISIEMCADFRNGKFYFTEPTLARAIELVQHLMKKYKIDVDHVIRHYDVTGKMCPKPFVDRVEDWEAFKEAIAMKRYNRISELPVWAKPIIQKLVSEGKIADGNKLDLSEDMLRVLVIMHR